MAFEEGPHCKNCAFLVIGGSEDTSGRESWKIQRVYHNPIYDDAKHCEHQIPLVSRFGGQGWFYDWTKVYGDEGIAIPSIWSEADGTVVRMDMRGRIRFVDTQPDGVPSGRRSRRK